MITKIKFIGLKPTLLVKRRKIKLLYPDCEIMLEVIKEYRQNYMNPINPTKSYFWKPYNEHIWILATWGKDNIFFAQMRWKSEIYYAYIEELEDLIFFKGCIFEYDDVNDSWTKLVDSDEDGEDVFWQMHDYYKYG